MYFNSNIINYLIFVIFSTAFYSRTWTIRRQTQRLSGKVQMIRIKEKMRITFEHKVSVVDGGSLLIISLVFPS